MADLRADLDSLQGNAATLVKLAAGLEADRVDLNIADQADQRDTNKYGSNPGRNKALPENAANALATFLDNADKKYMDLAELIAVLSLRLRQTASTISSADQNAAGQVLGTVSFGSTGGGLAAPLYGPGEQTSREQSEDTFINNVARLRS